MTQVVYCAGTVSELSSGCGDSLQEGDLITGAINIANERALMATMSHTIKNEDRVVEKERLVCA